MEFLSDEIVMQILSRVCTLYLAHAKCVCKRWRNIMEEPHWHKLHCANSISNPNNKILILNHRLCFVDLSGDEFEASRAKLRVCIPRIRMLALSKIVGSCNGLLCLTDSTCQRICIKNPFTNDGMRQLPKLLKEKHTLVCGFGYDSIRNLYKVMAIVSLLDYDFDDADVSFDTTPSLSQVMVCECGSTMNWRNTGDTLHISCHGAIEYPQAFMNGRLHWIRGFQEILSFDFTDEKLRSIKLPDSLNSCANRDVTVFQNRLCIVNISQCSGAMQMHVEVWIMKKYGIEESWVKEFHIESLGIETISKPPLGPGLLPWPLRIPGRVIGEVGNGKILLYCNFLRFSCMLLYEPMNNHKYKYFDLEDLRIGSMVLHYPNLSRIP